MTPARSLPSTRTSTRMGRRRAAKWRRSACASALGSMSWPVHSATAVGWRPGHARMRRLSAASLPQPGSATRCRRTRSAASRARCVGKHKTAVLRRGSRWSAWRPHISASNHARNSAPDGSKPERPAAPTSGTAVSSSVADPGVSVGAASLSNASHLLAPAKKPRVLPGRGDGDGGSPTVWASLTAQGLGERDFLGAGGRESSGLGASSRGCCVLARNRWLRSRATVRGRNWTIDPSRRTEPRPRTASRATVFPKSRKPYSGFAARCCRVGRPQV
mmetsp:Transcript_9082/g.27191  ORF Transcript_9082/g.27191 Transcript_9082/m.27191 type:complete len:275 (+) Transcript_9082:1356-2180(+)